MTFVGDPPVCHACPGNPVMEFVRKAIPRELFQNWPADPAKAPTPQRLVLVYRCATCGGATVRTSPHEGDSGGIVPPTIQLAADERQSFRDSGNLARWRST
jgi:hypothetical protein